MNSQRILIAEQLAIFRAGLRALIAEEPGLETVDEAKTGEEIVDLVNRHQPDLVLMDLCVEPVDALEVIDTIKRRQPQIKIIILTAHKRDRYVRATLEAGADGYVLKQDTSRELFSAIRNVSKGKIYLSPSLGGADDSWDPHHHASLRPTGPLDLVTECLLEGLSANKQDTGLLGLIEPRAPRPTRQRARSTSQRKSFGKSGTHRHNGY